MEKYELSEAKQNAVRNILYDKISLEHSCLTDVERTHLLLASCAYTVDPQSLVPSKRLHGIMDVLHFKFSRFRAHRMRYFYEQIKSIAAEGKKIHPERLQTLEVVELVKKGLNEDPSVSSISDEINEYKSQANLMKKRYSDLVEELIEVQRKESDEYFANKKPYKQSHNRRFDFEAKNQSYTNEEFIEKLRAVYGDDYDYSEVNYTNNRTVIRLKCKKHGDVFERLPLNLLKGWGCPSCNKEQGKTWANTVACSYDPQRRSVRWTTKRFVAESKVRFGDDVFDYSQCVYKNNDTPVTLIHKHSGKVFSVLPYEHLRHDECYDGERRYYQGTTDAEKILFIVKRIRENVNHKVYVLMQHIADSRKTIKCICPVHGVFYTNLARIYNGVCCPECQMPAGESLGERNVRKYLTSKGIVFLQEYRIEDKGYFENFARVDFFLPEHNIFIEFQGEQHYGIGNEEVSHGRKTFKEQKNRDDSLRKYAFDKRIELIEVPFFFRNHVKDYLDKYFVV